MTNRARLLFAAAAAIVGAVVVITQLWPEP